MACNVKMPRHQELALPSALISTDVVDMDATGCTIAAGGLDGSQRQGAAKTPAKLAMLLALIFTDVSR
jgi:hypothetical protein